MSKKLPHLTAFLRANAARARRFEFPAAAVLFVIGLSGILYMGLTELLGPTRALFGTLLLGLPAIGYASYKAFRWSRRPKSRDQIKREEAGKVIGTLLEMNERRRLHRHLDPRVASLLEECARHWERIHKELRGAFWTSPNLPSHWRSVRERSLQASGEAMDEVLLLVQPFMSIPEKGRRGFGSVLEDIVENVFDPPVRGASGPLPSAFEPARQIAERLKLLASEVETASREVAQHEALAEEFDSAKALDACLSELRSIRNAEEELERHIQQS